MDTDYYTRLSLDLSSPFFNKATQQTTAPGSTLKLLSAVTGMMENLVDDSTYIECTGKFDLVNPPINCWNKSGHGSLEIRGAIEQSCNYYFNMIGFEAGKNEKDEFSENLSLSKLQKYAEEFGLDENTGIEISEATPHVSDSKAVPSYIGQGNHLYTTSQLARYATAVSYTHLLQGNGERHPCHTQRNIHGGCPLPCSQSDPRSQSSGWRSGTQRLRQRDHTADL